MRFKWFYFQSMQIGRGGVRRVNSEPSFYLSIDLFVYASTFLCIYLYTYIYLSFYLCIILSLFTLIYNLDIFPMHLFIYVFIYLYIFLSMLTLIYLYMYLSFYLSISIIYLSSEEEYPEDTDTPNVLPILQRGQFSKPTSKYILKLAYF